MVEARTVHMSHGDLKCVIRAKLGDMYFDELQVSGPAETRVVAGLQASLGDVREWLQGALEASLPEGMCGDVTSDQVRELIEAGPSMSACEVTVIEIPCWRKIPLVLDDTSD